MRVERVVGIDVSKQALDVAIGSRGAIEQVPNTAAGCAALAARLPIAMERGGTCNLDFPRSSAVGRMSGRGPANIVNCTTSQPIFAPRSGSRVRLRRNRCGRSADLYAERGGRSYPASVVRWR
jgi:hypothetical protein